MNKLSRFTAVALLGAAFFAATARAITVDVYVDAAPNASGSPNYAPWWAAAQAAAVNGTFVNMANSTDPANAGTLLFNINDCFVYSFGDLGKRLQFVYWLPGETKADLLAKNFQIGIDLLWDGTLYSDWAYGTDWVTPISFSDYSGGVIGTAGIGIWGAFGVNTQAALDADIAAYQPYTNAFNFRIKTDTDGAMTLMTVTQRTPDAASTLGLMALGLGLVAACRRKHSN